MTKQELFSKLNSPNGDTIVLENVGKPDEFTSVLFAIFHCVEDFKKVALSTTDPRVLTFYIARSWTSVVLSVMQLELSTAIFLLQKIVRCKAAYIKYYDIETHQTIKVSMNDILLTLKAGAFLQPQLRGQNAEVMTFIHGLTAGKASAYPLPVCLQTVQSIVGQELLSNSPLFSTEQDASKWLKEQETLAQSDGAKSSPKLWDRVVAKFKKK